jgi:hypothetical protein
MPRRGAHPTHSRQAIFDVAERIAETKWRWTWNVFWTAAWTDRNRCADPGDLNRCVFRSRRLERGQSSNAGRA